MQIVREVADELSASCEATQGAAIDRHEGRRRSEGSARRT